MLGLTAFRRALDEKLDLAAWAADELLCRICVLSFRTHLDRMRAVEDIRAAVVDVA